jgi:hypothetical protein
MPPEYGEFKRTLYKMRKLYEFFSPASVFAASQFSLPPYLDQTRQEAFRNKLVDNMKMLQTSISGLENVDERDRFGNNPALATERDKFLQDSSSVLTYCQIDLFPTVRALYTHLLIKEDATDLIPLLRDILPEETGTGTVSRSGGEETSGRSQVRDSQVSVQHPRSEGASVDLISVGRDLLEKIRKHQNKLDAYVNGYIKSREQWVQCNETRTKLYDGKEKRQDSSSRDYWNKIKNQLGKIKMTEIVPDSLADEFKQDDIFKESLGKAFEEVEKVSKSPDSFSRVEIDRAIDDALSEMDEAITAADLIATECKESARIILGKIDELIDEIFKQNEDRARGRSDEIGTSAISAPPRQLQTEAVSAIERRESPQPAKQTGLSPRQ